MRAAPGAVPVLGHALRLWRDPWQFLRSLSGTCDIAVIRLGPRRAYLLVDPDLVRDVLVTRNHAFGKGALFEKGKAVFGESILSSEGDFHLRQRRLMQPAFHRARLASYTEIIRGVVEEISDSWRDGETIAVDREMLKISAGSVTRCLFSAHDQAIEAASVIVRALPVLAEGTIKRGLAPTDLPYRIPLPANRRYDAAVRAFHTTIARVIADYRGKDEDRGDLLSMLLAARDEATGEGMTDQQVHDETAGILSAGSETTAQALAWALHVLGTMPEVERRVRAELGEVLDGRAIRFEDIARLEYSGRLVAEVLRFYSPAFMFTRSPHAEVRIGGHRIPAGSIVLYSPYLLQHNPAVFTDPECFDPDRWRSPSVDMYRSQMPFGAGPHQCIGESFATTEMTIAIAAIAARWTLGPASGHKVSPKAFITCTPDRLFMTPISIRK